ncbi:histidinol-phosphatase [Oricola sp.]|uniref:histidinol-phosphatase n=1 Tax=Oricola sp. TaxID=1979950 RepID=UPI003BAD7A79
MTTYSLPDVAFLQRLAGAAAKRTLPLFRTATAVENKEQGGYDPVTQADRDAERAIRALIEEAYPEHGIVGEEFGTVRGDHSHVWIIDPVDGTRAYISGLPTWGTLVGLRVDGHMHAGFMSQPYIGELYVADGSGSQFMRGNADARPISTSATTDISESIVFTTSPALYDTATREAFNRLEARSRLSRYGCDCYAFAMLAAGYADIVVEPGLKTYDIAALIPVIEQAGGVVTTWQGGNAADGGDILAAANPALHAAALAVLSG